MPSQLTAARPARPPPRPLSTFCNLPEFMHNNPHIEIHPVSWTNDYHTMAKNYRMTSINSAVGCLVCLLTLHACH
jgi:hypothetical protein